MHMVNYSIRTQRKEQKMKSKHWCVQKVGEVVVQVLRELCLGDNTCEGKYIRP